MSFISRFLFFVVLTSGVAAAAAEKPRLVVNPFTPEGDAPFVATGRFSGQVLDELRNRGDLVQAVPAPAGPGRQEKAPARNAGEKNEAMASLEQGRKWLDESKLEEASKALKKGVELALADPSTADFPAVLAGYVSLSAAYIRMGAEQEAEKVLTELARLDPKYVLPQGYPPAFIREFERAKRRVEKVEKAAIAVEGPPGSTVYIDGHDQGMVPVLEPRLPLGNHYVKVESSSKELFGQVVDLKAGTTKVKATFGAGKSKTAEAPRVGPMLDESTVSSLQAFSKASGADYVLVGVVYRSGDQQLTVGAALYSAKSNGFALLTPVSFDAEALTSNVEAFRLAEEVVKKVQTFSSTATLPASLIGKNQMKASTIESAFQGEPTAEARVPVRPKLEPSNQVGASTYSPKESIDEKPRRSVSVPTWVWIAVGVAVAGGIAAGTIVAVDQSSKPVTGTVTAQW